MGFKPILNDRLFQAVFEPFFLERGPKTKSAILQQKMRPNRKVEENKPGLELNFSLKYKCAGHDFGFGGLGGNIIEP